jgi:tetratricopeptide (TPR) repeat protein
MHERLRARYVAELVADIALLSGASFERFGTHIVTHLEPRSWEHRGTNLDGAPVQHVVDSIASGGRFVAQYSSEAGYFDGNLTKLRGDIAQALANHPVVEKLWMLSSREQGPMATTKGQQIVAEQGQLGRQLVILDSRAIAEHIVAHLLDAPFVARIKGELTFLHRIATEWAMSRIVPKYEQYVQRPHDEASVEAALRENRHVRVVGISGIGKSAICSAIAQRLENSYELVLWVDAIELKRLEDLDAVDVFRSGERLNIRSLLRTHACLLVLDDLSVDLPTHQLLADADPRTVIMVTSQYAHQGAYPLSDVSMDLAREILEAGTPSPAPLDLFETIWRNVGGHPLILRILGALATSDPEHWDAVRDACHEPVTLEDNGHSRICERILNRHGASLRQEIEFLAWCGVSRVDVDLWKTVCGRNSVRNLERHKFLAAAGTDVIRVHDLVYASACAIAARDESYGKKFAKSIAGFVADEMPNEGLALQRAVRLHHALIVRELQAGVDEPALRYGYALVRLPGATTALLGDPIQQARLLATVPFQAPQTDVAIFSVIECIEALYTATRDRDGVDAARNELERHLQAFDAFDAIRDLPPTTKRDIGHHRAKALLWIGRHDEARAAFEALIAENRDFCAGRVQLARALLKPSTAEHRARHRREALANVEYILETAHEKPASVSAAVTLAAFNLLREEALKGDARRLLTQYEPLLLARLRSVAPFAHQQPFALVAALGGDLCYQEPELFRRIVESIGTAFYQPHSDRERFDVAQTLKFIAKSHLSGNPGRAREILEESRRVYEAMVSRQEFHRTQFAECLLLLNQHALALSELALVKNSQRNAFWYQRHAQALLKDGQHEAALTAIELALAEQGRDFHRSAFLRDRYYVRKTLNALDALVDLEEAYATCRQEHFKAQIEAELRAAGSSVIQ